MPGRQSTRAPIVSRPFKAPPSSSTRKRKATRPLDALAIAEAENQGRVRIRQNRLGESESTLQPRKRRRSLSNDDDDDDEGSSPDDGRGQSRAWKGDDGIDSSDLGEDSSGNEWKVGEVDDEDDSELDSDEAFGESDEEKFEGFSFGQMVKHIPRKRYGKHVETQAEDQTEDSDGAEVDEEGYEDDDDAMDLADILDQQAERRQGEAMLSNGSDRVRHQDEDFGDQGFSDDEEDDSASPSKLSTLQSLLQSMHHGGSSGRSENKQRSQTSVTPSDYGITSKAKLTMADLAATVKDPALKKSLKALTKPVSKSSSTGNGIPGKLDAPLPKRQQARIDRAVALDKSKETLNRWVDTVARNRRAEHLSFPLQDPSKVAPQGQRRLLPNAQGKPMTELESKIRSLLEENGLATAEGKSTEDGIKAFEELQTNEMPYQEVLARRAELRQRRELLFREEVRAKRIKKIKSKSFRKVHRKERERNAAQIKNALAAEGISDSESEKERNDRRRAEERMGARHRESRWAKSIKSTNRGKWDESAREGVTEMARRDEELRKRMEGKSLRSGDVSDDASDSDSAGSDDEGTWGDESRADRLLQYDQPDDNDNSHGSSLMNMKFMQRAESALKHRNDAELKALQRDAAGESESDDTAERPMLNGRMTFGAAPSKDEASSKRKSKAWDDFEEAEDDQSESQGSDAEDRPQPTSARSAVTKAKKADASNRSNRPASTRDRLAARGDTDLLTKPVDGKLALSAANSHQSLPSLIDAEEATSSDYSEDEAAVEEVKSVPNGRTVRLTNAELAERAFAGDDVVQQFQDEKEELVKDEDDKIVDNTMPGWGTWVGEGVSKKASKPRLRYRDLRKTAGVAPQKRKDAKLKDVIISEKEVKKTAKYLAGQLPHPFETRAQYERSLRLPVGPEWTTQQTFQAMTKPRILMKQGVITPMARPSI